MLARRRTMVRNSPARIIFTGRMPKPHRLPTGTEQALLEELRVELFGTPHKPRWNQLVRQHHYLKSADLVGEQLRHVVTAGVATAAISRRQATRNARWRIPLFPNCA